MYKILIIGPSWVGDTMLMQPMLMRLKQRYPDLQLHLIGPLQSNKVKEALALFDVIETVDRPSVVEALAREWPKSTRKTKFFVQVNIGKEEQKASTKCLEYYFSTNIVANEFDKVCHCNRTHKESNCCG